MLASTAICTCDALFSMETWDIVTMVSNRMSAQTNHEGQDIFAETDVERAPHSVEMLIEECTARSV